MTDKQIDFPVAFITGASVRIGAAIARRLHLQGHNLILHYRNSAEMANKLADEFNANRPDSALLVKGHLDNTTDLHQIIQEVSSPTNLFQGRLDVLVNNASAFYPTPVEQATSEQWDKLLNTNLRAPFLLAQGLANQLASQHGCIINITDIHGSKPLLNHSVYSMTKAGLISLTKSLAQELAPEIRTNAVSPGAILWPEQEKDDIEFHNKVLQQVPLKRLGEVDNIADTVWFLISNDYINGQVIAVDGGRSIS